MAGFADLGAMLERLAGLPSRITKSVANSLTAELHNEFLSGTDAYGTPWQRLAPSTIAKKGHETILVEHGDLANGTRAVAMSGAGIELISTEIGGIHQEGTQDGRPPRRPVLPDRDDLPIRWQSIIEAETEKEFKRTVK